MEWIAIEDREPPRNTEVIVFAPDGKNQTQDLMRQAYHHDGMFTAGYYSNPIFGVTHWMPMPEAPNAHSGGTAT